MYCVSKSQAPARRFAPLVAAALALTLTIAATRPVDAADPRAASMVIDANTGAVLHNKGGDELVYPASLTKMMTLYMTFELIELGRLNYDSKIKMTQEGADAAPSKLDLDAGEELTVVDAIKALVTKSANDVAIALAMHIGGTETNFARLMTRKARELGMQNTTFRNASGLPDPEQKTTARDMITLGLRLQDDFPRHYRLFSTRTFTYRGKTYRNHNTLLTRYPGHRRHQDRLHARLGIQPRLLRASRRQARRRRGIRRRHGARAQCQDAIAARRARWPRRRRQVTRKPALVARAPQPAAAKPPVPSCRGAPTLHHLHRKPSRRRRRRRASVTLRSPLPRCAPCASARTRRRAHIERVEAASSRPAAGIRGGRRRQRLRLPALCAGDRRAQAFDAAGASRGSSSRCAACAGTCPRSAHRSRHTRHRADRSKSRSAPMEIRPRPSGA